MADFRMTDPVLDLQRYLLDEIPALQRWLDAACKEHEEAPQSEYWLFSYVVRPYLKSLRAESSDEQLAHAWGVIEQIAVSGPAAAKNELFVMMEELDLWHFYRFMGPTLRDHWIEAITWYPTYKTRTESMNIHVNEHVFRQRWLDEIEKIGGLERLTTDQQNRITAHLWKEFRVERWHP